MTLEMTATAADEAPLQPLRDRLRVPPRVRLADDQRRAHRGSRRRVRAPRAADRDRRDLIHRPRTATLEPPAPRRGFSFALPMIAARAARDPAPPDAARAAIRRPPIAGPGSAGRAPRSAIRRPPDVARGPCLSGHSAPPGNRRRRAARRGRGPRGDGA
jgi:hypothetical protein